MIIIKMILAQFFLFSNAIAEIKLVSDNSKKNKKKRSK